MNRPSLTTARSWIAVVAASVAVPFGALWLPGRTRHLDALWDLGIGLGLLCLGIVAVLPLLSARWWGAQFADVPFLRLVHGVHEALGYVAVACGVAHLGLLLVLEPRILEYLVPEAPAPMLAALFALVLLAFLSVSSSRRTALRWRYANWRPWHAGLSFVALVGIGWHVWEAGYWYADPGARTSLVWMLVVPTVMTLWWRRHPPRRLAARLTEGRPVPVARHAVRWMVLLWLATLAAWGVRGALETPLEERSPCPVARCL